MKDPNEKGHLIIDEETAPYVKQIFEWARLYDICLKEIQGLARQALDAGDIAEDLAAAYDAEQRAQTEAKQRLNIKAMV